MYLLISLRPPDLTWWLNMITPGMPCQTTVWYGTSVRCHSLAVSQCHSVIVLCVQADTSWWSCATSVCPQHRFPEIVNIFYSESDINFHVYCLATCLLIMFAMWGVGTGSSVCSAPSRLKPRYWCLTVGWSAESRVSSHWLIMMLVRRHHLSVFIISSRTLACLVNIVYNQHPPY